MVWVVPQQVDFKRKNAEAHIWCEGCVSSFKENNKDNKVLFIKADIETGEVFDDSFGEMVTDLEEQLYNNSIHRCDQIKASIEEGLPGLCKCCVAQLRIFNKLEDLVMAASLEVLVMDILFKRRETLGPKEMFSCWDEEGKMEILRFIVGVNCAKAALKYDNNIDERVKEFNYDEWEAGFDHWKEGIFREMPDDPMSDNND